MEDRKWGEMDGSPSSEFGSCSLSFQPLWHVVAWLLWLKRRGKDSPVEGSSYFVSVEFPFFFLERELEAFSLCLGVCSGLARGETVNSLSVTPWILVFPTSPCCHWESPKVVLCAHCPGCLAGLSLWGLPPQQVALRSVVSVFSCFYFYAWLPFKGHPVPVDLNVQPKIVVCSDKEFVRKYL